ncbi:MAG: ATP-binding protein [Aggregatilineales bacterium]
MELEHPTNPKNYVVPNNIDFATDVKTDRLAILWKVTFFTSVTIALLTMGLLSFSGTNILVWVVAPVIAAVGSLLTRNMLKMNKFEFAAWAYTISLITALSCILMNNDETTWQIMPYCFVVVIFIVGLLLHPTNTFFVATATSTITIAVPVLTTGSFDIIGAHQLFACVLMFITAGLASQVTGELYAVTEWALMNYQRERRVNSDLFESRNLLHRSLKRSEALSDKLKDINDELEIAHSTAEAAKNFRGQFLANMSHELRTPLNAIIGFSETMLKFPMMYDDTPLPQPYNKDMGQIYSSGRQLLDLINDILDLARVDAGKLEIYMEKVDLKKPIDDVLAMAGGLVSQKPIKLQTDLPDELPFAWADETRVRQVLVNLYSNACKFTEDGTIKLSVRSTDEGVLFSLKDTGTGIPEDELGTIFEEFQQATHKGRNPRSGSGLGLAISRQLLTLMNGKIWAESTVGKGSTFYFLLQPYHKDDVDTVETDVVDKTAPKPTAESA